MFSENALKALKNEIENLVELFYLDRSLFKSLTRYY